MNGVLPALGLVGALALGVRTRQGSRAASRYRDSSARTPVPSVLDLDASRKKADRLATLFQIHAATMDNGVLRAWGEKHGMRLLGAGESRAVFTWPPGRAILHLDPFDTSEPRRPQHAIKFAYSSYGEEANRWEATIWRDGVPSLQQLLVPVVDVDPTGDDWPPFGTGGKWLVMPLVERAPPGPVPMSEANCKRLEACGIIDVRHTPNFSMDGRVLDYGKAMLDAWKRSPCRQQTGPEAARGSASRLPWHLRDLEVYTGARHAGLAAYFPKTAAGTLKPGRGESFYPADGIHYLGDDDGSMVPVQAEHLEPMPENTFDGAKLSALVDAIAGGDQPVVYPGYADLDLEDGNLTAQVRDGNHRTFAPVLAGSDMSWVMMSDATRQDLNDPARKRETEGLYRAVRAAQKEAGAPLFQRKVASRARPSKALQALAVAEARRIVLLAAQDAYYVAMLRTYGRATETGHDLEHQFESPQVFWRMRLNELYKERGLDWIERTIEDAPATRAHRAAESERMKLDLYSLRQAAGLQHGERLDPVTMRVVR